MRILLLTQLFQPEPNHLKGLAYAQELIRRGHEVEVLTGYPNYPQGRIYDGYRLGCSMREVLDGVPVVRTFVYPDHSSSGLRRAACYASFAGSACVPGLFRIRRPDVVHVYQGPASLVLPALALKALRRVPFVLDVQDLWPESVTASGMLRVPGALRVINAWCRLSYRTAARIVVLSDGYRRTLEERGVPPDKIDVVFNWCDESQSGAPTEGTESRIVSGQPFVVVFAGNMGRLQALDTALDAARILGGSTPSVEFLFVGDGTECDRLRQRAQGLGLKNVRFAPRRKQSEMAELFSHADALLIHLKDDLLCRLAIPQKTQAYLAAGRPIVMAVRGDAADLVARAGAGIVCEPENPDSLAHAVQAMSELPDVERRAMGYRGKQFYKSELSFGVGVDRMLSIYAKTVASTRNR